MFALSNNRSVDIEATVSMTYLANPQTNRLPNSILPISFKSDNFDTSPTAMLVSITVCFNPYQLPSVKILIYYHLYQSLLTVRNSSSSRVPLPSVSILAISSLAIFEATAEASPSIWKTRQLLKQQQAHYRVN